MDRSSFWKSLTAATAFLTIADAGAALAVPISSFGDVAGLSPTLARIHHGRPGGGHYGHRPGAATRAVRDTELIIVRAATSVGMEVIKAGMEVMAAAGGGLTDGRRAAPLLRARRLAS